MVCNKTEQWIVTFLFVHHLPFWFFLLALSAIHKHRCFLNLNDVFNKQQYLYDQHYTELYVQQVNVMQVQHATNAQYAYVLYIHILTEFYAHQAA